MSTLGPEDIMDTLNAYDSEVSAAQVYLPTESDVQSITSSVWSSFLDPEELSPLVPAGPGDTRLEEAQGSAYSASVSVSGEWRGHVVLVCSAGLAERAGAALLALEPGEATPEDLADAVGELINMIGGNVKSLVPGPCELSLPHVLVGGSHHGWPGTQEVCRLDLSWYDEPLSITVFAAVPRS